MHRAPSRLGLAAAATLTCTAATTAAMISAPASALQLHAMFQDHAVLQRDADIPVYGTAAPGSRLTVTLGEERAFTIADSDGHWSVSFAPRGVR